MLSPRPHACTARGFGTLELLIVMCVVGIMLAAALPNYATWMANSRVRTTADSIVNGLMQAKAEAVRRNSKVEFMFTKDDPVLAKVGSASADVNGSNWLARVYRKTSGTYSAADFIEGRSSAEGGANTTISAGQSQIVFNGVGRVQPVPASTIVIDVSAPKATRPLRITIAPGSAIRMCDPALKIANTTMGC
jgi:type IV fimbrial biogenesis protein FimT